MESLKAYHLIDDPSKAEAEGAPEGNNGKTKKGCC